LADIYTKSITNALIRQKIKNLYCSINGDRPPPRQLYVNEQEAPSIVRNNSNYYYYKENKKTYHVNPQHWGQQLCQPFVSVVWPASVIRWLISWLATAS